ncbi:MAG: ATP-NAD kinase family protein [Chloroflexi bacterium]|nr:ATP-NAD kinase family protein [Chloroflexota bacterium]
MKKKLGIIVNPVAGLGGRVGLKGTDGSEVVRKALELGATPESPARAVEALRSLAAGPAADRFEVVTPPGNMGADEAKEAGLMPTIVGKNLNHQETTSEDTKQAARLMLENNVDLLLFAGGDGTARDIYSVVGDKLPVVGIPAGVKMHSGVYATSPRSGARLIAAYFTDDQLPLREVEVMDIDEEAFREGSVSAKLYGYMNVPYEPSLVQGMKSGSSPGEGVSLQEVAAEVAKRIEPGTVYILGPGTTTRAIAKELGVEKTLLGVDIFVDGKVIAKDVTYSQVEEAIEGKKAKIVITPIGGQGHIFGRGNQQISPKVIKQVGKANIIVVSTPEKLATLRGRPLLVDTGDPDVDIELSGFMRVVTAFNTETVCRVAT